MTFISRSVSKRFMIVMCITNGIIIIGVMFLLSHYFFQGAFNLIRAKEYLTKILQNRRTENAGINKEFEKLGELKVS